VTAPIRVLCLDIEGGFGGSSRSLFESLSFMDRAAVQPEVWCMKDGPIRSRYEALNLPCRVAPELPRMNTLRRLSRNVYGYSRWVLDFVRTRAGREELLRAVTERFDLVHFNHESLFGLAGWLRRHHAKAQTTHIRTVVAHNLFSRMQARCLIAANDRLVFITENEKANIEALAGRAADGAVIYNVAMPPAPGIEPHPAIPPDGRLKVAVLSNYDWQRGIDRVVEVAAELKRRGDCNVMFVVAGDPRLRGTLPGALAAFRGRTLADYAEVQGVADMILFMGHVSDPERVLIGCDVLFKPTRANNPWGRDIIEGLAAARPVVSIGHYNRFVESGETGYLLPSYDVAAMAGVFQTMHADPVLRRRLGENASRRVAALCNGPDRARDLFAVWQAAVAERAA